jgi:hypothetical protein
VNSIMCVCHGHCHGRCRATHSIQTLPYLYQYIPYVYDCHMKISLNNGCHPIFERKTSASNKDAPARVCCGSHVRFHKCCICPSRSRCGTMVVGEVGVPMFATLLCCCHGCHHGCRMIQSGPVPKAYTTTLRLAWIQFSPHTVIRRTSVAPIPSIPPK